MSDGAEHVETGTRTRMFSKQQITCPNDKAPLQFVLGNSNVFRRELKVVSGSVIGLVLGTTFSHVACV
jgi:hypothetical protein